MYGGLNRLNEYTEAFPDVPTVLRIDNVNAWFCSQQFTEYGTVERRVKQSILGQCDAVTVANPEMKRRVVELTNESRTPVFEFIPVYNREISSGGFQFTVPGRVDEERRTYEEVVSAFDTVARQVGSDQVLADVRLTLLGSMKEPYGTKIVDSLQSLDDRGLETRYFRDRVPGDEFVTELRSSDVVVSPIQDSYTLDEGILGANSIDEEYGTTKPTGNVHDALRYGKPVLISDRYGIPETTYDSMIQYGSRRELATVLSSYITDTEYRDSLVDATGRSSRKFDFEQQSSRFEEIVRSVLREADL